MKPADLIAEALAGVLQRPGRSILTATGTILGVATFVTVLGLTATAGSQISKRFTALSATEVTVEDTATDVTLAGPPFPADAVPRVLRIDGVAQAGVYWSAGQQRVSRLPQTDPDGQDMYPVLAASPGAVQAMHPTLRTGRLYDDVHDQRRERVALLGQATALHLGITRLEERPAVFVDGAPLTVIGIIADVRRHGEVLLSIIMPPGTAERLWGPPTSGEPTRMIVETRLGAAHVVAGQLGVALRPDDEHRLKIVAPPDPRTLRDDVAGDLDTLFLILAFVTLVVGAVGIANTTLVAVLERIPEIGLRRSFGALGRHIAAQVLAESAVIGTTGGLIGACAGTLAVLLTAAVQQWTAVLQPWTVLTAPLLGTLTGALAGTYPALKASTVQPIEALRRTGTT